MAHRSDKTPIPYDFMYNPHSWVSSLPGEIDLFAWQCTRLHLLLQNILRIQTCSFTIVYLEFGTGLRNIRDHKEYEFSTVGSGVVLINLKAVLTHLHKVMIAGGGRLSYLAVGLCLLTIPGFAIRHQADQLDDFFTAQSMRKRAEWNGELYAVLAGFMCHLDTQAKVIREEGASLKEMPPWDQAVGIFFN